MLVKEKMKFVHFEENCKKVHTEGQYELQFKDGVLIGVRNEFGFKVEPQSKVWDYFSNKYNKNV